MMARSLSGKSIVGPLVTVGVLIWVMLAPALVSSQQLEVSEDNIYEHVEFLISIAPRFAGTQAETVAASYIMNEFQSYGLEAWIENFTIENSYVVEENWLRVTSPEQFDLTFIPAVYSPSKDTIIGQLVRVTEKPENLEQLRERVILVERNILVEGNNFLRTLVDLPPLAVLTYFENWPPYSEIWSDPPGAPLFWISGGDAQRLIELLEQGEVEVELRLKARIERSTSRNVVAKLPGENEEIIIVGAHHDSVLTPGAVDDASGVAVVLEMARVLSMENLPRTILFTTFGSEELGLLGSAAFVREHVDNKIVAAVVFDVIAPGPENGLRVGLRNSWEIATTEWLDSYAHELAENLDFYAQSERAQDVGGYSDYASFTHAGIPGTWVYWVNPQYGEILWPTHTLADNLDAIDKTRVGQVTLFGVELIRRLAGEDIEALPRTYESLLLAAFAVMSAGAVVLSIATGSFMRYKRGWSWFRAAYVFSLLTAAVVVAAYIWLLA
jgi:aminopeptidase YwaD